MSEIIRQNRDVEEFVRKNTAIIANNVEENPNSVISQYRRVYKCKDCDKEYDNFQALGGHRASHRKNTAIKTENLETVSKVKLHECRVCGGGFETGQALGGHMRKHWLPKVEKEEKGLCHGNERTRKTEIAVSYDHLDHESCSCSWVTSNSNGKERFGYDLNLTPHENELKNGVRLFD